MIHRTDFKSAESILKKGFDLKKFGTATAKSGQAASFGSHPRGVYLSVDEGFSPENLPPHPWDHRDRGVMIFGSVELRNPLVVKFQMEGKFYQEWLSAKYRATGARLTTAISKEGYDGIYCADTGEVVVFDPERIKIDRNESMESMRAYMGWKGVSVNFKEWIEAVVSSEDVGEALKRTLEMQVEGKWWDVEVRKEKTNPPAFKFIGKLRNEKSGYGGPDYFYVAAFAILSGRNGSPLFSYNTAVGSEELKITGEVVYFNGRGKQIQLGMRSSDHHSQNLLSPFGWFMKTPFEFAKWVESVVNRFDGFGDYDDDDDDNDDEPKPEWKPNLDPAGLVNV